MGRAIHKLSGRKILNISEPGRHSDGGGLYLRITASGQRSWQFMNVRDGKRIELGLGAAQVVSLSVARRLADAMREAVATGADPRTVRDGLRKSATVLPQGARVPIPATPTFGQFADEIVASLLPGFKGARHRQQWENTLKTYAAPIRDKPIDQISTEDMLAILKPIWLEKNETATRLRGRLERILGAAKAKGLRPTDSVNPAAWEGHLKHFLPTKRRDLVRHHGSLAWRDMPAFWAVLGERRDAISTEALRFTILTAARTSETRGARWHEIDMSARIWTIPKARMKMGAEHAVPLTRPTIAILERLAIGATQDDYIFPGASGGPLCQQAMLKLLQRDMGRPETVHGFRSSFRDWAGDATDFPRELAEQALAHAVGDAAEQAYRRGTAIEKRRPLMEAWAAYLAGSERD